MNELKLDKIESLLTRIWSGELEHNQLEFFCGTSKCVAGWAIYEELPNPDLYNYDTGAWQFAMDTLGLTQCEAELLFNALSNKQLHQDLLRIWKSGARLSTEIGIDLYIDPREGRGEEVTKDSYKEHLNYLIHIYDEEDLPLIQEFFNPLPDYIRLELI